MTVTERVELAQNAAGRMVPAMVNGKPQIPYLGVGKYQARGRKAAPPLRYPPGLTGAYSAAASTQAADVICTVRKFHPLKNKLQCELQNSRIVRGADDTERVVVER